MMVRYRVVRGIEWLSRLSFAMAAVGMIALSSDQARGAGEDDVSCLASNPCPRVDRSLALAARNFTTTAAGLTLVPGRLAPAAAPDDTDDQAPATGQASSPSTAQPSASEDQQQPPKVNPLTGMAVASQTAYTPLTTAERWRLYVRMTYASAGPYLSPLVNAVFLDQANGTPRQWGGGFPGFGRRLASRAGNAVLQGSFQAPLAALLHEDVRYIPTTNHSVGRRALHAVLYSFLTYNDQGHPTLNVANLTAFYASTAVTTAWLPSIGNAAKYTFSNGSEQIALSFPLNVVQEFWPEIRRHIFRRQ